MGYAKSEKTRHKLLSTTASLLRTRGFAAMGLQDIIAKSGVPRGSLYHHFPGGKEELGAAALAFSGDSVLDNLQTLMAHTGDPVLAMRAFCDFYVEQLESSDFKKGCPLATITLEAAADVDSIHHASAHAFQGIIDLFEAALLQVGANKTTARELAILTVSSTEGAIMLAKSLRSTAPLVVIRDQLTMQLNARLDRLTQDSP